MREDQGLQMAPLNLQGCVYGVERRGCRVSTSRRRKVSVLHNNHHKNNSLGRRGMEEEEEDELINRQWRGPILPAICRAFEGRGPGLVPNSHCVGFVLTCEK